MTPCLGIEIGGTKLQLALGSGDGTLRARHAAVVDASAGAAVLRRQLLEAARGLMRQENIPHPTAIGVGFGGPLDERTGTVLRSHHVAGWDNFPLAEWLEAELRAPVVVQNDSTTAALAEAKFGAGRGHSPMLYVNSGSGIGGGLIINGEPYQGGPFGSLEIGHIWLWTRSTHGDLERTTLENVASGWAISRATKAIMESAQPPLTKEVIGNINAQWVAEAALAGDQEARSILARACDAMGQAIATAITLLAPACVVLGGGVSQMDRRLWRDPIAECVNALVFEPFRGTYEIRTAQLGQDVVLHGALALASKRMSATC